MFKKLHWPFKNFSFANLVQLGFGLFWLVLTLPALRQAHFLYNLEPYPDGLYYVGEGMNVVFGKGFNLIHQKNVLPAIVPPLYSIVIALAFLIWPTPPVFYLANVVLGLGSLLLLWLLLQKVTSKWWLVSAGLLLYLLHGYVLWLPIVPMAENVALFLGLCAWWLMLEVQVSLKQLLYVSATAAALLATKYAYLGLSLTLCGVWLFRLVKTKEWRLLGAWVTTGLTVGGLMFLWFLSHGQRPWEQFTFAQFGKPTALGLIFYSSAYIVPNIHFYLKTLLGFGTSFLWHTVPLTSSFLVMLAIWGLSRHKKIRVLAWSFVGWLPLLALFYVHDARYMLPLLPILIVWAVTGLEVLPNWKWQVVVCGVVIVSLFFSQSNLYREVIVGNVLGRSRGWQYLAVQEIGRKYNNTDTVVITALPPVLFDLYGFTQMRLLPLSNTQEFAQKEIAVWGEDVNYNDLTSEFQKRLDRGEKIVVTNAYITHTQIVREEYEALMKHFKTDLVQDGCQATCNVYKLSNSNEF